jgi:hypothetical protein
MMKLQNSCHCEEAVRPTLFHRGFWIAALPLVARNDGGYCHCEAQPKQSRAFPDLLDCRVGLMASSQ